MSGEIPSRMSEVKLQDYPLDELMRQFQPDEVTLLNEHQIDAAQRGVFFTDSPVPTRTSDLVWNTKVEMLCQNTTDFPDEIEDFIFNDPIINAIIERRKRNGNTSELARAFRARRSVVALQYISAKEIPNTAA